MEVFNTNKDYRDKILFGEKIDWKIIDQKSFDINYLKFLDLFRRKYIKSNITIENLYSFLSINHKFMVNGLCYEQYIIINRLYLNDPNMTIEDVKNFSQFCYSSKNTSNIVLLKDYISIEFNY